MWLPDLSPNKLHGLWVSDRRDRGSYGRIAYAEQDYTVWVLWNKHHGNIKGRQAAGRLPIFDMILLGVQPEPWYASCQHCGNYPFMDQVLWLSAYQDAVDMVLEPTI
jgi:hypothetical protein